MQVSYLNGDHIILFCFQVDFINITYKVYIDESLERKKGQLDRQSCAKSDIPVALTYLGFPISASVFTPGPVAASDSQWSALAGGQLPVRNSQDTPPWSSHLWGSGRKQLDLGLWAAWDLGKCGHSYNGNELKKVAEWKMWKVFGGCIWPVFLEQMVCSREYWSKAGKGVRSSMNKASGCHAKDWTWGLSDPKMSMAVQSWTSLILFDLGN